MLYPHSPRLEGNTSCPPRKVSSAHHLWGGTSTDQAANFRASEGFFLWKLQGEINQQHHISCLSLFYMNVFILSIHPLIPGGPSREPPQTRGQKQSPSFTTWQTEQTLGTLGHPPRQPCGLKTHQEAQNCRQSTGRGGTHIPRGVALSSPQQHDSHHFAVAHLRRDPQGRRPVLKTKEGCWEVWLLYHVLPIWLPKSAYWNGWASIPQ